MYYEFECMHCGYVWSAEVSEPIAGSFCPSCGESDVKKSPKSLEDFPIRDKDSESELDS